MSDTVYVECCQIQVPRKWAIPYWYLDKPPVYLCCVGRGCSEGGA